MYCLRTLLALAHPLMPFVTERLWGALPAAPGAQRQPLITAAWPSHAGAVDETAIAQYEVRGRSCAHFRSALPGLCAVAATPVLEAPAWKLRSLGHAAHGIERRTEG